ncbi:phage tail tape measure protein [Clostridium sp. C2-6-12]|uniref:phage tail tape measure protein n=1 Tax=Clostridium sp. C2-6-12 TaxID=2698832 RepID=UPI00136F7FFF|nr:phage tail tape measure protein [Clostridium sp. C2-6-12]
MSDDIQGLTIKVGITDEQFTGGVTKINKAMSLLQSEFKASSESLKAFGDGSQQLSNKSEYLNKAIELQQQKVKALQEAYAKSKQETGEFSNSTMSAGTKVNNAVAQLSRLQNELKQVDQALQNDGKEIEEEGNAWTKLGDKIKSATSGMGEYIKKGVGLAIGGDIWNSAKEGFTSMITFGSDLQKSLNGVQAATGYNENAMSSMRDVMVGIYNDNFGENFEDIGEAIKTIGQQTGATGDELKALTEDGLLLRDTFGFEVNESVRSANMMMQQFGMTGDEAYNLIAQGAQYGLDKNGDLLDSINEYSVQFKQAGFSADEMFNMLVNGSAGGTFSVDKLGDSIKEFGIRSKDGSKSTMQAFTDLGFNADEMSAKFAQGGDVGKQAFEEVNTKLLSMQDPLKQNQIGVSLWGTMWEDLGVKGIASLTNTQGEISNTNNALQTINQVKYNDLGSAFEGIKRNIETGILLPISDNVLPKLSEFSNWFVSNMPNIKDSISGLADKLSPVFDVIGQVFAGLVSNLDTIIPLVITFGATFGALQIAGVITAAVVAFNTFKTAIIAGQGVMAAFNLVCSANPISLVIIAIGALVAGIILMYNKVEWFRNGVNAVGAWLKTFFTNTLPQAFNSVVGWFKSLPTKASSLWENIKGKFNQVINFFVNNWKQILLFIYNPFAGAFALLYKNNDTFRQKTNEFIEAIKSFFINGWNAIANFFTSTIPNFINSVGQWFAELPNKIMFGLGQLVGMLATWGVEVWNYFSTNVPMWINNVTTFFSQLPTNIWNFLVDIVTKIGEWGSNVLNYITTNVPVWISSITTFFSELPNKIWEFLVSVVTKLGEWGGNVVSWISTNVSQWIESIVKFFSELPNKIWTWLVNVVTKVTEWGGNMLTEAKNGMEKVVTGIEDTFKNLPSKMMDIGKNIVLGIKDGIKNAWDSMTGWIGGLCESFTKGVKDKFEIHSPSHIFRDEIGKMLAQGIGVGFETEMPQINTNISKTLSGTVSIANLDNLKNVNSAYSNSSKESSNGNLLGQILDKMDRLEKALDISIDGKSIVKATARDMNKELGKMTKNNNTSKGRSNLAYV